jgi:CRP/FNR family cyclic AMP-dependent transcriptional regulator
MSSIADIERERIVRLLEYDPDLGRRMRPARLQEAQLHALAPVVTVPGGRWDPSATAATAAGPYGLLVLDGLISRDLLIGEVASAQLVGRGDLIQLQDDDGTELMPLGVRWTVLEPATIALLDDGFLLSVQRWPEVVAGLFERVAAQSAQLAKHRALCQLPRVADRVHALLWFLAERWGRVTAQGVILPLKLTHGTVGQLVGAKRPTVSLAVKELAAADRVHRRRDGAWLLQQEWAPERPDGPRAERSRPGFAPGATSSRDVVAEEVEDVPEEQTGTIAVRLRRTMPVGVEPAPADPFADVRTRIDRMRDAHQRVAEEVRATRARSAVAREQSAALRRALELRLSDQQPADGS